LLGALAIGGLGLAAHILVPVEALLVALAGLMGCFAESFLGTFAERKGWLDNDLLNALNTAIGAFFVCLLARIR
jgi:uncharacterized membrane protein